MKTGLPQYNYKKIKFFRTIYNLYGRYKEICQLDKYLDRIYKYPCVFPETF